MNQPQRSKQIGDWVVVNAGINRGITGEIIRTGQTGFVILTADGKEITTAARWLDITKRPAKRREAILQPLNAPVITNAPILATDLVQEQEVPVTESPVILVSANPIETAPVQEASSEPPVEPEFDPSPENDTEANVAQSSYADMTVVQLQLRAKEFGVSIARTKSDFIRILKELHPELDVATLKGPELYNQIADNHISRLRSKQDLVDLLTAKDRHE